jgi:hypothetical protein
MGTTLVATMLFDQDGFEKEILNLMKAENRKRGFPAYDFQLKRGEEIRNIIISVEWRVDNTRKGNEIESIYSKIKFSAKIKSGGGFGGSFEAMRKITTK